MSDPLNITNEMRQFDLKNRDFYDSLTDEQQKKFAPYLMIRWGSSVTGGRELQEFYVIATNQRLNRYFFGINSRHRKLQWLLATTVSPDMGAHRHKWIAPRKKPSNNKHRKEIAEIYPHLREDELDLMAILNTPEDIKEYRKQCGEE